MRIRTRAIAAAAVTAALAAGSTAAAVASTTGKSPGAAAKTMAASSKSGGSKSADEQRGHDAMVAAVARELHVSTARVSAALAPIFAAGYADPSSPAFAAAANSLGVSVDQLSTALIHAKESLAAAAPAGKSRGSSKSAGAKSAQEQQGHDAMVAAVASDLHVSTARVSAALAPIFAAGYADPSSQVFAAAAHSLGVSVEQLSAALIHAKQGMAGSQ